MRSLPDKSVHMSADLLVISAGDFLVAESVGVCLQHEKFQSAPGSRVGTPAYLAPEVIMTTKGQTYDGKVGCCWMQQQLYIQLCPACCCRGLRIFLQLIKARRIS